MGRDGSSKREVKPPKNRYLEDDVPTTIKKKGRSVQKGLSGPAFAVAMLACFAPASATASTTKTTPLPPIKKKQRNNTTTSEGNKRGTPALVTYQAVERRLREAGLWNQAVAFHNDLDLMEVDNLTFTRLRERIRMHRNEDGSLMRRLDGSYYLSSKSRPKAFGMESQQAEYEAAMMGDHPEYLKLMKKHRYQEVIDFINIKNPSWEPGDVGRFLTHRMLLYCGQPKLGTFDDKGAYVKGKCSYAVRAQLQAKTGQLNKGAGPGHDMTGILAANISNAAFMRQAAENPEKDLGPWTLVFYHDRRTGNADADVAFKYSGDSFQWTDLKNLTKGYRARSMQKVKDPNFKFTCHGEPREGSLPWAFLDHRMKHPVYHNDFEHSGLNISRLFQGLAGLRKQHESENILALLPCAQAYEIIFENATVGRREDSSKFLKG